MSTSRQHSALFTLLLLGALGGLGALLVSDPGHASLAPALEPGSGRNEDRQAGPTMEASRGELAAPGQRPSEVSGSVESTVIHPLEVSLTLLQRGAFEALDGVMAPGSGDNARLAGSVTGNQGAGQSATVRFLAGPNRGRVLRTDSKGRFGASNLAQGLSIVEVESDRGTRSVREVLLRQLSQAELNVSLGRDASCSVRGLVKDRAGQPLGAAQVHIDGQLAYSDDLGEFFLPRISPGKVLCVVRKEGFASHREQLLAPRQGTISRDRLTFTLEPAVALELSVEGTMGSRGPSTVFIFPVGGQRVNSSQGQRTFPWHEVNPILIEPGKTKRLEGLPAGHISLAAFHPGAVSVPVLENKKLFAKRENQHLFRFRKARGLQGVVLRPDGTPAKNVLIRMEAPDRGIATTKVIQQKYTYNLQMVLPPLPSAVQEVRTDARGRFDLTLFPHISKAYYLTAETQDGLLRVTRTVKAEPKEIVLQLEPVEEETGEFEIELHGRFQGLPIRLSVMGSPREEFSLGPEDTLSIDGLQPGIWRVEIWWDHKRLEQGLQFDIEPGRRASMALVLPRGALEGQTAEERARAGK